MVSRQVGRRAASVAASRHRKTVKKVSVGRSVSRKNEPLQPKERRRLIQLVVCGGVFVLLVAVKLLLPDRMAEINGALTGALEKNMDVQAVFSAVGGAFAGEKAVGDTVEDVYQAVFHGEEKAEAVKTGSVLLPQGGAALELLQSSVGVFSDAADDAQAPIRAEGVTTSSLVYVLYSEENLPPHVSMEQSVLNFSYCPPLTGVISSGFGYREPPADNAGRFHYGIDLAAETGSEIVAFADGTVTVTGESSSYGKYCVVDHGDGYTTLYAHCSRITATSGAAVKRGQKIAEVGETGMATGSHLHFELQREGLYLNPIYYVSV